MSILRSLSKYILGGAIILMALGMTQQSAEAKRPKVFIACETYSIRDHMSKEPAEGKYDMISVMKVMKDLGMKGVTLNDIWMKSYDKPYLDQIKKAAKDNGIIIAGFICEGNLSTTDEARWKAQVDEDAMKMKAAAYLGAKVVRLNLGGLGDQEKDDTIGTDNCIKAFKELIPLAKQLNIKMTIENHGGPSKKADNIVRIIKATDPKWVGSCLDFMNWPAGTYYDETAKLAQYAYHTHAKCRTFKADGEEETIEYSRMIKMLQDAKYKGAISIEFEGPGDQLEGVRKTRDLILKYWKL